MSLGDVSPARLLAAAIDAVRVNRVHHAGGVWVKRRRWGMGPVIVLGNAYLRLARTRVRMFPSSGAWCRWEVQALSALHGEGTAWPLGRTAIAVRALPGVSLRQLIAEGRAGRASFEAAGRELRRAHGLLVSGRRFSHGDPHAGNVVVGGERAWLIDVETVHEEGASDEERHADDLLVLALDIMGRVASPEWLDHATAALEAYGDRRALVALEPTLEVPRGLPLSLLCSRAHRLPIATLERHVDALRARVRRMLASGPG